MSKMIVIETTPELVMDACLTLANMVVKCKRHPELLKLVPDECAEEMVISVLRVLIERSNAQQSKGADPAQEKADEEKLEQSVNAAMEALLKAAGK